MKKSLIKGFTLIELVIVMLVIAILGVSAMELLQKAAYSQLTIQQTNQAQWDGQMALARITSDLHSIQSPNNITVASASALTFKNIDGTTISYQLSGNNLLRNSKLLAANVQSLTFAYYDSAGAQTVLINNIRYITVNFSIHNSVTYDFTTGVFLWTSA